GLKLRRGQPDGVELPRAFGGGAETGKVRDVDRKACGRAELRDQAAIDEARRIAICEAPAVAANECFEGGETFANPAREPLADLRIVRAELFAQRVQHAQVVEWMDVA